MSAPLRGASVLREQSPRSECDADDEDLNSKAHQVDIQDEVSPEFVPRSREHDIWCNRIFQGGSMQCVCTSGGGRWWGSAGMVVVWKEERVVSRDQTGGPRGACGVYVKGCAMMCSYRLMDTAGSHES
ncbi:hypothetical protein C8R43DRAFT_943706 [Mycena crocata]|nr:hypothetical protein C8R43DRAFT_943702 [Mycena crocata]KAJ7174086.1 hypothetical protein C8R43DRAFT_943706 [Mycena crocata]